MIGFCWNDQCQGLQRDAEFRWGPTDQISRSGGTAGYQFETIDLVMFSLPSLYFGHTTEDNLINALMEGRNSWPGLFLMSKRKNE